MYRVRECDAPPCTHTNPLRSVWCSAPLSPRLDVEERRNGPQSVSRGSLITTPRELMGFKRIQSVGGRH